MTRFKAHAVVDSGYNDMLFLIVGNDEAEVTLMSNMNSDIKMLKPYTEALQVWMEMLMNEMMDQQVVKTDMKVRHIYIKALEVRTYYLVFHHFTVKKKKKDKQLIIIHYCET